MKIMYELQEPFGYSWNLARILIVICVFLVLAYVGVILWPRFYDKYYKKIVEKTKIPALKARYIRKLEKLLNMVNSGQIKNKEAYTRLSLYIREFIKKVSGINVLSSSKEEIKAMGIPSLSLLMEEYYPPEFSKNTSGNIASSIERSIGVIKEWK